MQVIWYPERAEEYLDSQVVDLASPVEFDIHSPFELILSGEKRNFLGFSLSAFGILHDRGRSLLVLLDLNFDKRFSAAKSKLFRPTIMICYDYKGAVFKRIISW